MNHHPRPRPRSRHPSRPHSHHLLLVVFLRSVGGWNLNLNQSGRSPSSSGPGLEAATDSSRDAAAAEEEEEEEEEEEAKEEEEVSAPAQPPLSSSPDVAAAFPRAPLCVRTRVRCRVCGCGVRAGCIFLLGAIKHTQHEALIFTSRTADGVTRGW